MAKNEETITVRVMELSSGKLLCNAELARFRDVSDLKRAVRRKTSIPEKEQALFLGTVPLTDFEDLASVVSRYVPQQGEEEEEEEEICDVESAFDAPSLAAPSPVTETVSHRQGAAVVWFRSDLRTHDHPALLEAAKRHAAVVPVFVWAPEDEGDAKPGRAAQIWLRGALASLAQSLERLGSQLVLRRGSSYAGALKELVKEVGATKIYFCKRYEPWGQRLDEQVRRELAACGVEAHGLSGYLLYEPTQVRFGKQSFGHWGTLMPFFKACLSTGRPRRPLPAPERLAAPAFAPHSEAIDSLGLESGIAPGGEDWGASIRKAWPDISEAAALRQLDNFVERKDGLRLYEKQRSRADLQPNANSKLSAYIRWGQLSAHDLYWSVENAGLSREETKTFGRRLFWRDLAYFQLHHFPEMRRKAIRAHYDTAQWCVDKALLRRWQRGETGYPLVDASMRELRATGWVQQNVRMVGASFLTEFLNISWTEGAKWYEDQLVDADLAINSMMWQNAGRSGIDQWNFLISPVEAKAQDPTGSYVRRWLPELAGLPTKYLHAPWDCPPNILDSCGVRLGENYPTRCVLDLRAARESSKQATLAMRRGIASTWMNDQYGYDVIALPGGATTKVFTKREYRLTRDGRPFEPSAPAGGKGSGKGRAAATVGRAAKVPRVEAVRPRRQTSLEDFACAKAPQRRWTRLRGEDD
mmetsp:Transcript_131364/g.293898  ORF Transcript_131364/g.293898 Transcript_131364/m.293898 type:complete len:698 (+) Transcript_131364:134-2227(+)